MLKTERHDTGNTKTTVVDEFEIERGWFQFWNAILRALRKWCKLDPIFCEESASLHLRIWILLLFSRRFWRSNRSWTHRFPAALAFIFFTSVSFCTESCFPLCFSLAKRRVLLKDLMPVCFSSYHAMKTSMGSFFSQVFFIKPRAPCVLNCANFVK